MEERERERVKKSWINVKAHKSVSSRGSTLSDVSYSLQKREVHTVQLYIVTLLILCSE